MLASHPFVTLCCSTYFTVLEITNSQNFKGVKIFAKRVRDNKHVTAIDREIPLFFPQSEH